MLKIKNNTIHITRGDEGTLNIKVPIGENEYYEFKTDDVLTFIVKRKNGFNSDEYVLKKQVILEEDTTSPNISLVGEDTLIGEPINKPVTYWYEVSLNDTQTFICYDENGPKELILYPDGYNGELINND